MKSLHEIGKEIEQKSGERMDFHKKNFDAATKSYKFAVGDALHTEFVQRENELKTLHQELSAAKTAAQIQDEVENPEANARAAAAKGFSFDGAAGIKTLGERYTESEAFKNADGAARLGGISITLGDTTVRGATQAVAMKAITDPLLMMSQGVQTGYPAHIPRTDIVVPRPRTAIVLQDLILTEPYRFPAVEWMEQTVVNNNADVTKEGEVKPQSFYKWEPRTTPMVYVAHWVHITRQQLENSPALRSMIDNELLNGLREKVQDKLLNGLGGADDIQGLLTMNGLQHQARGAEDPFSAIYHAFTRVRGVTPGVGFAEPDIVLMHPANWDVFATTKDNNNNFIYGSPAAPVGPQLWGKTVVPTTAMPLGKALVGDSHYDRIWEFGDARVEAGRINDDFIRNQLVVLCEIRMCQTPLRPSAFCDVTGLESIVL